MLLEVAVKSTAVTALGIAWMASSLSGCEPAARAEADGSERAQAHVEKTCVGCHPGAKLDEVARRRNETGADALDTFLKAHHVADTALRAEVVAYLRTRLADESPPDPAP
jgi:hypothetical protein